MSPPVAIPVVELSTVGPTARFLPPPTVTVVPSSETAESICAPVVLLHLGRVLTVPVPVTSPPPPVPTAVHVFVAVQVYKVPVAPEVKYQISPDLAEHLDGK